MTMKKILFALLTGWMAISFTACDDFLDRNAINFCSDRRKPWLLPKIFRML